MVQSLPLSRLFDLFRQRRYFACHVPMLGGEPGHRQEGDALRPPGGGHHKHGWNGALRGRGSHLHRPDEWDCAGLGPDCYRQVRRLLQDDSGEDGPPLRT